MSNIYSNTLAPPINSRPSHMSILLLSRLTFAPHCLSTNTNPIHPAPRVWRVPQGLCYSRPGGIPKSCAAVTFHPLVWTNSGCVPRRDSLCRAPVPLTVYYDLGPFMLRKLRPLHPGEPARVRGGRRQNQPWMLQTAENGVKLEKLFNSATGTDVFLHRHA